MNLCTKVWMTGWRRKYSHCARTKYCKAFHWMCANCENLAQNNLDQLVRRYWRHKCWRAKDQEGEISSAELGLIKWIISRNILFIYDKSWSDGRSLHILNVCHLRKANYSISCRLQRTYIQNFGALLLTMLNSFKLPEIKLLSCKKGTFDFYMITLY